MKKFLLILFVVVSTSIQAQDTGPGQEKIQALKIAFITQKLNLSSEEAQKFWPVYNQYDNEIKSIQQGDVLKSEEQLLNIRKKYKSSFEKVIGQQKLNKLFNAERDFRSVLIQRLKNQGSPKVKKMPR
jgi:formiminotetrahydrofolate cyclodeaminase